MRYYYIADFEKKLALCVNSLSEAKKIALEKKCPIYTSKFNLPDWVFKIEGFCDETLRRADGKFAKKFSSKFFNEDVKNS